MADGTPHIANTSPHHWKYIAEGGSTIVFSYTGPPHPAFNGTALRLRKGPVPVHEDSEKYQRTQLVQDDEELQLNGNGEEEEPDDPTIVFQRTVIERLLPREFLPHLDAVHVERWWLLELTELTEPLRPLERRLRDRIDTRRRKAVLATDLVGGKGWAVEIKPKWGFLPAATYLSPETREIKMRTCRFCMHAHLKSTHGAEVSLGYCPLDLFSREETRVKDALHTLWDVWIGSGAAVNNLRVFVEGKMVRPTADPTSLTPLAEQLFLSSSVSFLSAPSEEEQTHLSIRDAFTATLLPLLLHTPVLTTLATLQRTLDALDVEGLSALWARLRSSSGDTDVEGAGPAKLGSGEVDPDMDEWARFVDAYLARQAAAAVVEGEANGNETDAGTDVDVEETEEELRYRMTAYLLSASFKDCSVIVRMRPPTGEDGDGDGNENGNGNGDERKRGTITVIDLDVKGIDRLAKWAKLDREIVEMYRGVIPKDCRDSWAGSL